MFKHKVAWRSPINCVLLLIVALGAFGNGLYIHAKARLAQYLIADAWQQSLIDGRMTKPWSWADTWPVARLRNSRLNQDLFVLAGASGSSLAFGPGHLDGSALPGQKGSMLVGGHRDTHFNFLKTLHRGDRLRVQGISGSWFTYQVNEILIRDSRVEPLFASSGQSELLLVTCYPFDAVVPGGPLRYVVQARLLVEQGNDIQIETRLASSHLNSDI